MLDYVIGWQSSKAHVLSQAYHRYALNYINALNYLETLRRHIEFCEFEKVSCEAISWNVLQSRWIHPFPLSLVVVQQRSEVQETSVN